MGLNGRLEELSLLEILQVIAFSRKTGHLHIEGPFGRGGVVLKEGAVHLAYSPTTVDTLSANARPEENDPERLVQLIELAMRELTTQHEGRFDFEMSPDLPDRIDGLERPVYLQQGIETQSLLLQLAKEQDEEQRETSSLLEALFEEPDQVDEAEFGRYAAVQQQVEQRGAATAESPLAVVVVDDEPLVTRVLAEELESHGYEVRTASGPLEGVTAVRSLAEAGKRVLVATDLRMPTSTGRSFLGGFELVHSLRSQGLRVPVLLMAEKLPPKAQARIKKLGVRRVAFKPALSKLDPKQYATDLRSFASALRSQIPELAESSAFPDEPSSVLTRDDDSGRVLDLLTSMSEKLMSSHDGGEIPRMVLRFASQILDRGVLFLLKRNKAHGLAGFGLAGTGKTSMDLARSISLDLLQAEPFAEVVHCRCSRRFRRLEPLDKGLFSVVGRGLAKECVLVPMLNNNEVLAMLYGDNGITGKPLGKLSGLEVFMALASVALENHSLHRKVTFLESNLSFSRAEKRG